MTKSIKKIYKEPWDGRKYWRLRLGLKLSRQEVANQLGVSVFSVFRWENGFWPKPEIIEKLNKLYESNSVLLEVVTTRLRHAKILVSRALYEAALLEKKSKGTYENYLLSYPRNLPAFCYLENHIRHCLGLSPGERVFSIQNITPNQ